jgi:hypothetical protein
MGETRNFASTLAVGFGTVCAAFLALAVALSGSAAAHDLDCHGMPVSEAKKLGCCGAGDAHFGEAWQFYEGRRRLRRR